MNVGATVHVNEGTGATSEVYTTGETYNKTEVDNALTAKGAATDVATNKADIAILKTAVGDAGSGLTKAVADQKADIATNRANINNLDGKLANLTTTVNGKADEADVNNKLAQKADQTAVTALDGRVGSLETTVGDASSGLVKDVADLKKKTTKIDYNVANDTTSINGIQVGQQVDMGGKKLTNVGTINGIDIGDTQVDMNGKNLTGVGTINGIDLGTVDTQVKTNAVGLKKEVDDRTAAVAAEEAERKAEDKKLSDRIGTVDEDGNYIEKSAKNNVSENLKVLDKQAKTNADNIKDNRDEIARVNGELVKTNNYFNTELSKTNDYFNAELSKTNNHFNTELGKTNAALQAEGKARAEAEAKINTKIGNIDDTRTAYVKDANSISQNLTTLDEKLQDTNDRTGGIKRNTEDTQTTIEGTVKVDKQGDVKGVKGLSAETITTTGNATIGGALNVTGASDLKGDVTLGTPNGTNTVTVNGKADFHKVVNMDNGLNVTNGDTKLKATTVEG